LVHRGILADERVVSPLVVPSTGSDQYRIMRVKYSRIERSRYKLLTGEASTDDRELANFIAALRGRIPVIPTQRWTAGLDQMPDNTQEALVYASPPTGAVYKLIVANNDGTVKGAVRLDEVAVDPQGRP